MMDERDLIRHAQLKPSRPNLPDSMDDPEERLNGVAVLEGLTILELCACVTESSLLAGLDLIEGRDHLAASRVESIYIHLFRTHLGGWRRFCRDRMADAESLWKSLPGGE